MVRTARRYGFGGFIGKRRNGPVQLQRSKMKKQGWFTHCDALGWGIIFLFRVYGPDQYRSRNSKEGA